MTRFFLPLAFVATLLFAGCGRSPGPGEAAKTFLDQATSGRAADAYASGTFAFKAQQSSKFFETMLREQGLDAVKSASYAAPEMDSDGRTARVRADFVTKAGKPVALVATLTKEGGAWRVFSLKSPRDAATGVVENRFSNVGRAPDFSEAINRQPAPDEAAVKKLIRDCMLRFDDALEQKSFVEFFEKCSLGWQDQLVTGEVRPGMPRTMRQELSEKQKEIGASRLYDAFKPFIDNGVRLTAIKELQPTLDGTAEVNTDGLLIVSGHYSTTPYTTVFRLKFTYEIAKWKLFGLDISLRK
jgi:hypothetical protein